MNSVDAGRIRRSENVQNLFERLMYVQFLVERGGGRDFLAGRNTLRSLLLLLSLLSKTYISVKRHVHGSY